MDGCPATASRAFRRDPPNGYILPAPAPAASRVPRRDGGTDEGPARTPLGTPRGPRVALDRARARLGRDSRARTARRVRTTPPPLARADETRAMSHPSADARAAPFAPSAFGPRVMNPLHRPAPLPATPPRLDQDSARARRSMLGHWIAHTTGHHLDARSDEVRAFSAIPWRVAEITLEKNTKKIFPSRVAFRARARRSTPSPLIHAPTAHPRRPPTRPFSRSGFLRGSLGRRRPVQAPKRARARDRRARPPRGRPVASGRQPRQVSPRAQLQAVRRRRGTPRRRGPPPVPPARPRRDQRRPGERPRVPRRGEGDRRREGEASEAAATTAATTAAPRERRRERRREGLPGLPTDARRR